METKPRKVFLQDRMCGINFKYRPRMQNFNNYTHMHYNANTWGATLMESKYIVQILDKSTLDK